MAVQAYVPQVLALLILKQQTAVSLHHCSLSMACAVFKPRLLSCAVSGMLPVRSVRHPPGLDVRYYPLGILKVKERVDILGDCSYLFLAGRYTCRPESRHYSDKESHSKRNHR